MCLGMGEGKRCGELPEFEEGLIRVLDKPFYKDTAGAMPGGILGPIGEKVPYFRDGSTRSAAERR